MPAPTCEPDILMRPLETVFPSGFKPPPPETGGAALVRCSAGRRDKLGGGPHDIYRGLPQRAPGVRRTHRRERRAGAVVGRRRPYREFAKTSRIVHGRNPAAAEPGQDPGGA